MLVPTGALSAMNIVISKRKLSRPLQKRLVEMTWDARSFMVTIFLALVPLGSVCCIRSPWKKLPPGPRGLPILGNALRSMY